MLKAASFLKSFKEKSIQGDRTGCRTGNGEKLSGSQAEPGQAMKSASSFVRDILSCHPVHVYCRTSLSEAPLMGGRKQERSVNPNSTVLERKVVSLACFVREVTSSSKSALP